MSCFFSILFEHLSLVHNDYTMITIIFMIIVHCAAQEQLRINDNIQRIISRSTFGIKVKKIWDILNSYFHKSLICDICIGPNEKAVKRISCFSLTCHFFVFIFFLCFSSFLINVFLLMVCQIKRYKMWKIQFWLCQSFIAAKKPGWNLEQIKPLEKHGFKF